MLPAIKQERRPHHQAPSEERVEPMGKWLQKIVQFLQAEDGPTAVEYAVMLALIVVVCLVAITAMGTAANKTFGNIALQTATAGS
jgi:pilus assembly protein Flp/PilA